MDNSKTPLFDQMAADLAAFRPQHRDEILCPMCLGTFGRADVRVLTKEHAVSKSLGGRPVTLTCKACNNVSGHQIQGHLKTLFKLNEGFRGDRELRGRFTLFDETVPVGMEARQGGGLAITALGGSPRTIAAIETGFQSQQRTKWSLQLKVPYSAGKASAAIARAAYLTAFCRFGYRYILSDPVNLIREEIVAAMDKHSDRLCLLTGKGVSPITVGGAPESVIVPCELADGYRFFVAFLKFQENRDYWMFCALPVAEQRTESLFEDLRRAIGVLETLDLKMEGDEQGDVIVRFVSRE